MKIGVLLILLGCTFVGYSLTLEPYTDEHLFHERYQALQSGQSVEYWKLRDEMLTPGVDPLSWTVSGLAIKPGLGSANDSGRVLSSSRS